MTTVNPLDYIVATLTPVVLAFQTAHPLWPPEMIETPCDLHERWVERYIDEYYTHITQFIRTATEADFNTLLTEVFTQKVWTANRRVFFTFLYKRAAEMLQAGDSVSKDLVTFYRLRYNKVLKSN